MEASLQFAYDRAQTAAFFCAAFSMNVSKSSCRNHQLIAVFEDAMSVASSFIISILRLMGVLDVRIISFFVLVLNSPNSKKAMCF